MEIDSKMVQQIATLARLKFEPEELDDFAAQFAEIVGFIEQLSEVDTSQVGDEQIREQLENVISADRVENGFTKQEAMANAPQRDDDYFLVPKVISGEEE